MKVSEFSTQVDDKDVSVKVYFKKIKYVRYRIVNNSIKISIPQYISNSEKQKYIDEMLEKAKTHLRSIGVSSSHIVPTEINILGDVYRMTINESKEILLDSELHRISYDESVPGEKIADLLAKQINTQFFKKVEERIVYINKITLNKRIQEIKLKANQSSWGLCSHNQKITISTNTLLTPPWVMDYVIVHELCHLKVKNHSKLFWQLVEKYYPKYREAKKWLKENGRSVNLKNIFF